MYCYVVKWPVFCLQRGSAKSPIAPSNSSPLCLGQGRSLSSLGGIAVGILAIGVFLQQYNYRYSAIQHGLSNLEYDYLKNNVADSKKRKKGNGNRKRKIDHSSGYGLFSSASNNELRSLFSVLNFESCPI